MSNDDKKILVSLADNSELLRVVKETVLEYFAEVPYAEGASDELLGQITRARLVGRQKVEKAFIYIASFASKKESTDKRDVPY